MNHICKYASSGCNYPEGECVGLCMKSADCKPNEETSQNLADWMDKNLSRWIVLYLVLLAAIIAFVGCDNNGFEQAMADEMEQVQRWEVRKADRVAQQISDCINLRGPGAVPVFDEQGFVVGCMQRRK